MPMCDALTPILLIDPLIPNDLPPDRLNTGDPMAHIVILGAGVGGMPAAYDRRATLDADRPAVLVQR